MNYCELCGAEITEDVSAYISERQTKCEDCWNEWYEKTYGVSYYGMAPHQHRPFKTSDGSQGWITIGLDYKTSKQDKRGRYWIEDAQMWFTPDAEMDGAYGVWEER